VDQWLAVNPMGASVQPNSSRPRGLANLLVILVDENPSVATIT
jgi:hypothetical protein